MSLILMEISSFWDTNLLIYKDRPNKRPTNKLPKYLIYFSDIFSLLELLLDIIWWIVDQKFTYTILIHFTHWFPFASNDKMIVKSND